MGGSQPDHVVRQKKFDFAGKIWHTCLGFRGRVPRHRSVVSLTRFGTAHESQKAIGNENLQVQVV